MAVPGRVGPSDGIALTRVEAGLVPVAVVVKPDGRWEWYSRWSQEKTLRVLGEAIESVRAAEPGLFVNGADDD